MRQREQLENNVYWHLEETLYEKYLDLGKFEFSNSLIAMYASSGDFLKNREVKEILMDYMYYIKMYDIIKKAD